MLTLPIWLSSIGLQAWTKLGRERVFLALASATSLRAGYGIQRAKCTYCASMQAQAALAGSVLHPTDFSDASYRAFAHALAIAVLGQTQLTILHVSKGIREDDDWVNFPQVRETLARWRLLEPGSPRSAIFDELNVIVRKRTVRGLSPIRATRKFLDEDPHDLVVLATEGSEGAPDWLHRSDAEAIARGSGAMTLFVPSRVTRGLVSLENGDLNLKNILLPVDGNVSCTAAIEFARRSAEIIGDGDVRITILHVGPQMPPIPGLPEGPAWTWQTSLRDGQPVDAILSAADDLYADLIVMTTNGRDTLDQALLGSTTERVLRKANCPVLAVPEDRARDAAA